MPKHLASRQKPKSSLNRVFGGRRKSIYHDLTWDEIHHLHN